MRSALYYPHTEIRSEALLKSALLLWDKVYTIAPNPGYQPYYESRLFQEAYTLIGKTHEIGDDEKALAHSIIEDFATRPLPHAFSFESSREGAPIYELYPEKFFPETWQLLQEAGLSGQRLTNDDFPTAEPTGLSLMSILADCCAGTSLARVTDRGEAYASLSGLFIVSTRDGPWESDDPWISNPDEQVEKLVPIALKVLDLENISLESLIDLRKREETSGAGSSITRLRHNFVDHLKKQAELFRSARTNQDVVQMQHEFEDDLRQDYVDLKEALRGGIVDALLTKEVIATVIASATTLAPTVHGVFAAAGGFFALGGLAATGSKLFRSRKKLMLEHPSAYLYEVRGVR